MRSVAGKVAVVINRAHDGRLVARGKGCLPPRYVPQNGK